MAPASHPPREVVEARIVGPRSTVEVYRRGHYRCLRFADGGGLVQGRMHLHDPLDFGSPYLGPMCAAALGAGAPRHALCLGLGVGALPRLLRALWPALAVDVVEIDPAVVTAAARHFGCMQTRGLRIIEADAAEFVIRPPPGPPYDVILLDCYDGQRLPAPLTEAAFVRHLLDLLAPAGVAIANVVSSRPGALELQRHLAARLCGARVIAVPRRSNRIWFGGRSRAPDIRAMAGRAVAFAGRLPFDLAAHVARAAPANGA